MWLNESVSRTSSSMVVPPGNPRRLTWIWSFDDYGVVFTFQTPSTIQSSSSSPEAGAHGFTEHNSERIRTQASSFAELSISIGARYFDVSGFYKVILGILGFSVKMSAYPFLFPLIFYLCSILPSFFTYPISLNELSEFVSCTSVTVCCFICRMWCM